MIPIDEIVVFDVVTHVAATGAISDADSAPTFDVFEEDTDTPILAAQTMTKRTSKTGDYRGSITCSAANGFEAGKWYSVVVSATVSTVSAKCVAQHFRVAPVESQAGVPKSDLAYWLGAAPNALQSGRIDSSLGAVAAGVIAAASFAANALDAVWSTTTRVLTAATNLSIPSASDNATALLDASNGIETSLTPRQAMRLMSAALAGKLSGAATTTITIRNTADSKDRITAQVDADGNRSAVTYDLT